MKIESNSTLTYAQRQARAKAKWLKQLPASYAEFEDGFWQLKFFANQAISMAEEKPGEGAKNAEHVYTLMTELLIDTQTRLKPALDKAADEAAEED